MDATYQDILRFIEGYFPAYSQYGQIEETHRLMDKYYAPELTFDDGAVTSREQWYKRCLAHPAIQDKLTVEHIFIDDKQKEVGALLKTQAIRRATGEVLLELKMNVLYSLKIEDTQDLKIAKVRVFLESDPAKGAKLFQIYAQGG